MADPFAALVALLARLEDELPYVTVDDVCDRWEPAEQRTACAALITEAIADRRLFTDLRQRLNAETGARTPVRLVRLNRLHPQVEGLL